jgi:glycosyltransferase involved in cell wall biosynthesis
VSLVFFYPQFKKLTGAERLILKLADYASRDPFFDGEVVLLTHRLAGECRPALGDKVRLVETGLPQQLTGNHYVDAAVEYVMSPALAALLPRLDPTAVVFFGPPSVPAMWFARRMLFRILGIRVPVLYFCFEPPRFIYRDTEDIVKRLGALGAAFRPLFELYRALDRRMVRSAHRVLSNSPYGSRKIYEAYGRPSTVIQHGVDFARPSCEDVTALRRRLGLEGRKVAVTVNHLHPRKRIDLFLRAVHHAARAEDDVTALVIGGGPEAGVLRQLAQELGMREGRDVVFTGAVAESELPAHFALGNVYVHTGREESFGLSVIEAMWLGLPVVTVAEGGPCDTVRDGWNGFLRPAAAAALGDATASLLGDPAAARTMGERGAGFVRAEFRWERGARTLLRVIDVISERLQVGLGAR